MTSSVILQTIAHPFELYQPRHAAAVNYGVISGVISKHYRVSDIAVRCAETYIWLERNRL